jgi:C-terminal processing protease CtpA/Prc
MFNEYTCVKRTFTWLVACIPLFLSCYKNDPPTVKTEDEINKELNQWIYNTMSLYYYWEDEIPDTLLDNNLPPSDFFKSLLSPKDKFSAIFNHEKRQEIIQGTINNLGFETVFGYLNDEKKAIGGLIIYVYPSSNADKNGLKRGDIFTVIDGYELTSDNYENLFYSDCADFTFIRRNETGIDTFTQNLCREQLQINPIHTYKIIETGYETVGYICYNQFIADNGDGALDYKKNLLTCFKYFKDNNINELIVDLRYNPGGLTNLATMMASLIVPNVDTTKIALHYEYNKKINKLYQKEGGFNSYFEWYPYSYVGNLIRRVFFITGPMTASASEAVINAINPYMDVVLVGTTSYGKNYASSIFTSEKHPDNNCVIMPIILKLYNARHESEYENGFTPDYQINEYLYRLYDLGDTNEIILNTILTKILPDTYTNTVISKSCNQTFIVVPSLNKLPNVHELSEFENK